MKTPYLVQRGEIKNPIVSGIARISEAVNLDYMGSAEFEFGALPRSLRALQAVQGSLVIRKVPGIKSGESQLRVISAYTEDEFKEYTGYLLQLREDKIRLKENSRFAADYPVSQYSNADFWWDIQNHVMWSFHKPFMNRIKQYLESSWTYMDHMAKKEKA